MRLLHLFTTASLFLIITSCGTQKGIINNYLQTIDSVGSTQVVTISEPLIQKNDLLSIKVYSLSADPRTDLLYNLPETVSTGGGAAAGGILVDNNGNIDYPRLGTLKAEGLTKNQLAGLIRERLDTILRSPSVVVRFLNYKITVLGEVRTPGSFNVPTERVTILEALGLAGDITDFGNKTMVKVAREKDSQLEIGYVDLTSRALFTSPFFRLQQNDVVFVEQNRRKQQLEERQTIIQQIGIATGVITAIALIVNFIR
jgi:polysaccharide export outer membrane protein